MPPGASQGSMVSRKRSRRDSDAGTPYGRRSRIPNRRIFRELTLGTRPYQFRRLGSVCEITALNGVPSFVDNSSGGGGATTSSGPANTDDFNTIQFGAAQFFKLNTVQGVSDFTSLFDQYKIDKVVLQCMFQSNAVGVTEDSQVNGGKGGILPILYYTQDLDDAAVPNGLATVQQFARCKTKILNANKPFNITIRPKVARQVYQAGVASGYETASNAKIDNNFPDVQHYGMKYWIRNWFAQTSTPEQSKCKLTIQPVYYLSMYNSR